jgi:hypothetical protein
MQNSRVLKCAPWLLLIVGCSSSSGGGAAPEGGAPKEAGSDSGKSEAGADGGNGDAASCNGSVLPEFVTENLTLTKAGSPYHAPLPVLVGDTANHPILTIDPGVTVTFASEAYLSIGMAQTAAAPGGLKAIGTAASPILLTSDEASPRAGAWGGVYFNPTADANSTLSHATVKYAGQQFAPLLDTPIDLGSVYVDAGSASPLSNSTPLHILLSNLTVANNGGSGVVFFGPYAGFAAGSGALVIPDWASGGYPIVIDPNSADTLPSTLTTGTGKEGGIGIVQEEQNISGGGQDILVHNETWPAMPIPYIVDSSTYLNMSSSGDCGLFIDGTTGATITLTIAPPNTIEFPTPEAGGACGIYVSQNQAGGRIVANGTASAGIVFTSGQATPAQGDWAGITVSADPPSTASFGTTSFAYCTFSYAGTPTTSELYFNGFPTCGSGIGSGTEGPPVDNCTFANYSGCAINGLDLTNEPAAYGTGTTGTNGNTFMSGTMGVCAPVLCVF